MAKKEKKSATDKSQNKAPRVSTVLEMDKQCKSSARFRSPDTEEKVTTSLYLLTESWEALGKPTTIKVAIAAVEELEQDDDEDGASEKAAS